MTSHQGAAEKGSYVALHTIGRQDDINPPEGAHEARNLWDGEIRGFSNSWSSETPEK